MPIPFPDTYDTLCHTAGKGKAVAYHGRCDRCHAKASFVFSGYDVERGGVIALGTDGRPRYQALSIPLARCTKCGRWARVLPIELLPRKIYGLRVIQQTMNRYLFTRRSLRKAVRGIVFPTGHAPRHSTLCR